MGPVGLATAISLARKGCNVIGIDVNENHVRQLRKGNATFFEPSLSQHLKKSYVRKRLTFTDDSSLNAKSDVAFITVGTPSAQDGSVSLDNVRSAAISIGESIRGIKHYQLVAVKSTVTPGTARCIVKPAIAKASGKSLREFGVCSNPEFLREGNAMCDADFPDRIIIGGDDLKAIRYLERFYRLIYHENTPPIKKTTYENAELIKYANNAFLATKVSFINCIANIAERTPHSDVTSIADGIGLDERIGRSFLNAGFGWGGSCIPKDMKGLVSYSRELGYIPTLLQAVEETNEGQIGKAAALATNMLGTLKGKCIAILGLAFKPGTDDMREAIAITIIRDLLARGANVKVYDPKATGNAQRIFSKSISYAANKIECLRDADCCMLVTEWDEFRSLSPDDFTRLMRTPVVIDGRRLYNPARMIERGVQFAAIGLGPKSYY
jgi:UDPglucose 6-dehydrogenase